MLKLYGLVFLAMFLTIARAPAARAGIACEQILVSQNGILENLQQIALNPALVEDIRFTSQTPHFSQSNVGGVIEVSAVKGHWHVSWGTQNNVQRDAVPASPNRIGKFFRKFLRTEPGAEGFPVETAIVNDRRIFLSEFDRKVLEDEGNQIFEAKLPLLDWPTEATGSDGPHSLILMLNSSLRLNVASLDPQIVYTMRIRVRDSVEYSLDFQASREGSDVELHFSKFRSQDPKAPTLGQALRAYGRSSPELAIQVLKDHQTVPLVPGQKFALQVHDQIRFERDLRDPDVFDFLTQLKMSAASRVKSVDYITGLRLLKEEKALIQKLVQNLYHLPNVRYALETLREGEDAVVEKLRELGFQTLFLDKALNRKEFFKIGGFFDRNPLSVPVEKSAFGEDHSVWAHALQVLAMTKDMSPQELQAFQALYQSQFGHNMDGWVFWDTMFDAPGARFPNAPRFWKARMQSLGLHESTERR